MPLVIAGPILRKLSAEQVTVWLITSQQCCPTLNVLHDESAVSASQQTDTIPVGKSAFVHLINFKPAPHLVPDTLYEYALTFDTQSHQQLWQAQLSDFLYAKQKSLNFRFKHEINAVLHGSCRKPHYAGTDALKRVDELIAGEFTDHQPRPDILLMTGDQIYADDVAGPTLQAIQQVILQLGLVDESLTGALVENGHALAKHPYNYYYRQQLLPQIATNTALSKLFFGAKKKPIFTSVNAHNHLITFAEIIAMYCLVWSPYLWRSITFDDSTIDDQNRTVFQQEQLHLQGFIDNLPAVQRALAHIPTYMIFDDHDITDDWNLTRGWEQEVYSHPLSKRMVGNALMGYWLCQGWGNEPEKYTALTEHAKAIFSCDKIIHHDDFIDELLAFDEWHYSINTSPPIEVLDTRTQRWRSESRLDKPSGLMDWEALCAFQQNVIGHDRVIVVSAAPIFGVKLIEAIQKLFTFFGKALTVDAENWMAHKGTANVILNIFRHVKTPPLFIILSGDVHYSFVYDVKLRFRRNSPHILQFTCSGIKNTFPDSLIKWLERFNRFLYDHKSPLNIFTRRRNMSVEARKYSQQHASTIYNGTGIGLLTLGEQNDDQEQRSNSDNVRCQVLSGSGDTVQFAADRTDIDKE